MKFSPDAAIGVFRIAQEALTNILKHSEAKSADLSITIGGDTVTLQISDDGKGIASAVTAPRLASMRHRIGGLGGTWDVRSPPSGGAVVMSTHSRSRACSCRLRPREASVSLPPGCRAAMGRADR